MSHRLLLVPALLLALIAAPALAANPQVELDTSAGAIRIELYPDAAPKTVDNFLKYVKDGHYAGTQFHRVIKGFMIQGGGYDASFWQRPTRAPIPRSPVYTRGQVRRRRSARCSPRRGSGWSRASTGVPCAWRRARSTREGVG